MEGLSINERYTLAWGECANPALDGENEHFGNRYASLASSLAPIKKACAKYGVAYAQRIVIDERGAAVESRVIGGGEVLRLSRLPVNLNGNAQQRGSELTYAKRQLALMDWGIAGEEDDDAEAAVAEPPQDPPARQPTRMERMRTKCAKLIDDLHGRGVAQAEIDGKMLELCGTDDMSLVKKENDMEMLGRWLSCKLADVVANEEERF